MKIGSKVILKSDKYSILKNMIGEGPFIVENIEGYGDNTILWFKDILIGVKSKHFIEVKEGKQYLLDFID